MLAIAVVVLVAGALALTIFATRARRAESLARETVIERQVVVMRCRFCGALTPVDLDACERCGAGLV